MSAFKKDFTGSSSEIFIREVAERCASATIAELSSAVGQMSAPQLCGYVRAMAWPHVLVETQAAVSRGQLAASEVNVRAAKVLERTVRLVASEYHSVPVIAMPAPHIGRRAA